MNPNEANLNHALNSTPGNSLNTTGSSAAATSTEPPAGPATASAVTVADIVSRLREVRQLIPEFALLPLKDRRSLVPQSNLDPNFVAATINAAGASPLVETMLGRTQPELRQEADDSQHWTQLEDELRAMLDGVATGNRVRRSRIGKAALDVYAISRRLAMRPEHAALLPHVATMKRLGHFGRSKAKATAPAPAPKPVPSTVPSTEPQPKV